MVHIIAFCRYCPSPGSGTSPASYFINTGAACTAGSCPPGALQIRTTESANACFGVGDILLGATAFLQQCNATDPRQLWRHDATTGLISSYGSPSFCLDGGTPLNISCADRPFSTYPYCDPALPPAQRARDLIGRMLPSEKVQNMVSSNPGVKRLGVPPLVFSEALHGNPLLVTHYS